MFREEQKFRQGWVWTLVGGSMVCLVAVFGYAMYQQLVLGRPWGDRPMSDTALAVVGTLWILFAVGMVALFAVLKLVTEVRDDGVHIRYVPFVTRRIGFDEIESCEARTYRAIREYGGWGVKWGPSGKAYNVRGNRGVQLRLAGGGAVLIGSQRAELLADAIKARLGAGR